MKPVIPHSRPLIDDEDVEAVVSVLRSGHIAQGEKVRQLEEETARCVGRRFAAAVSSGTAALHLSLLGLGIGPGDEVIIPSYVCSSLYMAVLSAGAAPRIVDIRAGGFNIDPLMVRKAVTSRTRAIIVPHMFGTPADLGEILEAGPPVVEDCAQALGAEYRKRKTGSFGRVAVLSFYATKLIAGGEGGMVLTDDEDVHRKVTELREYDKKPLDTVHFNYKMTDIHAALALSQLRKLDGFISLRRKLAAEYDRRFAPLPVRIPETGTEKKSIHFRYVLLADNAERIREEARRAGIMCEKPVWEPLHRQVAAVECPNADLADRQALSVPLYPALKRDEIDSMLSILSGIISPD